MLTSPGFGPRTPGRRHAQRSPRFAAAMSPRHAFDRIGIRHAPSTARRRAMCSAWADAFGCWATAIEPCRSQMIYAATGKSIGGRSVVEQGDIEGNTVTV